MYFFFIEVQSSDAAGTTEFKDTHDELSRWLTSKFANCKQRRRQALESEGDELPAGGAVSPPMG